MESSSIIEVQIPAGLAQSESNSDDGNQQFVGGQAGESLFQFMAEIPGNRIETFTSGALKSPVNEGDGETRTRDEGKLSFGEAENRSKSDTDLYLQPIIENQTGQVQSGDESESEYFEASVDENVHWTPLT